MQVVMAQLLFAHAHRRPALQRSESSTSLPTPPDTLHSSTGNWGRMSLDGSPTRLSNTEHDPFAASANITPPSFTRPRKNRPKHADRITKQAAAAYREHSSALNAALEREPDNPFLERPGEVYRGKELQAREQGVVNYVFRGKRISFDSAYYAPSDVLEAASECPPKLLFPTPESPERPAPMPTPKKPLTPPRFAGIMPPTPESVRKPNIHRAGPRFHPYAPPVQAGPR